MPRPTPTKRRTQGPCRRMPFQASEKLSATGSILWDAPRISWRQSAAVVSSRQTTAQPWIIWISLIWEKSARIAPKTKDPPNIPSSSNTDRKATTCGCFSGGVRSVASARPAVCTVWMPMPTTRKATAALAGPAHSGPWLSPERMISAKGIMDRPENMTTAPFHT